MVQTARKLQNINDAENYTLFAKKLNDSYFKLFITRSPVY